MSLAIRFLLASGCRPADAAYVVYHCAIERADADEAHGQEWKAVIPGESTKSRFEYVWGLDDELFTKMGVHTMQLHTCQPALRTLLGPLPTFKKAVANWFTKRVLPDAADDGEVVGEYLEAEQKYNMRSVRAWHGTRWCEKAIAAKKAGKEPPLNPLQHTDPKMTIRHYFDRKNQAPPAKRLAALRDAKQRTKQKKAESRALPTKGLVTVTATPRVTRSAAVAAVTAARAFGRGAAAATTTALAATRAPPMTRAASRAAGVVAVAV